VSFLFARRASESGESRVAERLHDHLVAATRRPVFYLQFGVPDTFEGRFDLLVLHVALTLRRLRSLGGAADHVAQELVDLMFARFDIGLREMGVSDIGVPKRMKRMAQAFNGRTASYFAALDGGDRDALADAIGRNVLGGKTDGHVLADYALQAERLLASRDLVADTQFPDLPEPRAPA
jgi:cytochrome b pre-mRNA-processing protein 3